jgi:uncharacterized protein
MKKVIIAGGTGLIGNALTNMLMASGYHVSVLTRNVNRVNSPGSSTIKWDGKTPTGWGELANGADAVINLAGQSIGEQRWTKAQKERIFTSRIQAGEAVVAACEQAERKPRVVIQASAIGYYGNHGDESLKEDSQPGSDFLAKVCIGWENSTRAVEALGIRRVVIRTGLVLSTSGGVLERILLPIKLFAGGPLGSGKQWYSWIHLQDELGAIRFILENENIKGAVNLCSPGAVQMNEFGRVLAKVIHRPYWLPVPAFALKLLLGEMGMLVLEGQRVAPASLQAHGFRFKYETLEPALTNLLKK